MSKPIPLAAFAAVVKRCIKDAGGQRQLAEALGVNQQHISYVSRGVIHPQPKLLQALGYERVDTPPVYRKVKP